MACLLTTLFIASLSNSWRREELFIELTCVRRDNSLPLWNTSRIVVRAYPHAVYSQTWQLMEIGWGCE